MIEPHAMALFDALGGQGFVGGFDCAVYCVDGHYGMRSKKGGVPKSDRWCVAVTPMDRAVDMKTAVDTGTLTKHRLVGGTYYITGWEPADAS